MPIDFGFPIPQVFLDGRADLDLVRRTLALGERLGFHSAWVQDQVAGDVPLHESLTLLSYAAALTTRVRLGVSVLVFPIRNPVHVAKIVSTLDNLSAGRMILGVGLGHVMAPGLLPHLRRRQPGGGAPLQRGHPGDEVAVDRARDELRRRVLPAAARRACGRSRCRSPTCRSGSAASIPMPCAARSGTRDGYTCAGPNTTDEFAGFVAQIRQFLDEEGRDPATLPLSKRVYLAIDDDAARAKRRLDEFFGARYPWQIQRNPDFVADICVWGSTARVAEGLARVARIGATTIITNPLWDFEEQLEALASEVIPAVNALL